ncbi:TetR/AcrR family transcriptional regulator [Actinokineospora alba]|uniref:TetR/AcrR family transcriptional regulator n=1 Tax=Actinokineospora alba TaxID=504798 RepID=UPI0014151647|nr:TetR family transcriptional regulator [Actinokineospora alba]
MPHPDKRYAKGEQRREQLLRAAIEIAAEQGVAAVTHRAVTERAGVPYTSVSYFFGTIEQLGVEALQLAADDLIARLDALAADLAAARVRPDDIARHVAELLTLFPPSLELARYEVLLQAARSPDRSEALARIIDTIHGVAEAALRAAGAARPADGARAFAAMAEGFTLHHLVSPRPDDVDTAERAYRTLFRAYAAD